MDDEPIRPEKEYPLSASKMSKTPSWIMLGFLLGAAFVAALPPLRKAAAPEPPAFKPTEPARATARRERPELTTIEDVFAVWGRHAVWSDDVTEVALWNIRDKAFSNFYEVRRIGDAYYFRSLPHPTRRVISRGKTLAESPLLFTETEEQYREWLAYGRTEQAELRNPPPPSPPSRERGEGPMAPVIDPAASKAVPPPLEQISPPVSTRLEPAPSKKP